MTTWILVLYWCANAMASSCVPTIVPGGWADEAACLSASDRLKGVSPRLDKTLCLPIVGRNLAR